MQTIDITDEVTNAEQRVYEVLKPTSVSKVAKGYTSQSSMLKWNF